MSVLTSGTKRVSSIENVELRDENVFIPRRRSRKTSTFLPIVREPKAIPVTGISRAIEVKFASTQSEWEQAFQLVAASYQARGYETPGANRLRFTPYHALPDTRTLIAQHEGTVIATLSIVQDNTLLGLPMEDIYGDEIAALRREGRRMFEVSTQATVGLPLREYMQVFTTLIRLGTQYHAGHGGDAGVITINPRHRQFFMRILGFEQLGPRRTYAAVQDHPAEAFWITEGLMHENAPTMHQIVFGEHLPSETLFAPKIPRHLVRQFSEQSSACDPEEIEKILALTEQNGSLRQW